MDLSMAREEAINHHYWELAEREHEVVLLCKCAVRVRERDIMIHRRYESFLILKDLSSFSRTEAELFRHRQ